MLLPALDNAPLYKRYDHSAAAGWSTYYGYYAAADIAGSPVNADIVLTRLPIFECASDPNPFFFTGIGDTAYSISATQTGGARTNYDFCVHYQEYYHQGGWAAANAGTTRTMFESNVLYVTRDRDSAR
jgi:hypothetical protein